MFKRTLDIAIAWQVLAERLTAYYKEEGFTYTNICEALLPAIDLFEKLLIDGGKENEKN